jgi:hypothetical protein
MAGRKSNKAASETFAHSSLEYSMPYNRKPLSKKLLQRDFVHEAAVHAPATSAPLVHARKAVGAALPPFHPAPRPR